MEGGTGDDEITGGTGDDTYIFAGENLGIDQIVEASWRDRDTLDFSDFAGPVRVDLASTEAQVVNGDQLTLVLSSGSGIEDVVGC